MAQTITRDKSVFAVATRRARSELELAAARAAARSIEESIGALERRRVEAGFGSWLRLPIERQ